MPRARGRRPAGSHTRQDIATAAKRQFAELGYPRTTLRGIAREADVDTRLVTHYFGSKQNLFVSVIDFPYRPEDLVERLTAAGRDHVGHALATLVVEMLSDEGVRQTLTGLLRAAASEDEAADLVRDFISARLLAPLGRVLDTDRPELRAGLIGGALTGYLFGRHIVRFPGLVDVEADVLAAAAAPVLQHYLTGDLGSHPMARPPAAVVPVRSDERAP